MEIFEIAIKFFWNSCILNDYLEQSVIGRNGRGVLNLVLYDRGIVLSETFIVFDRNGFIH